LQTIFEPWALGSRAKDLGPTALFSRCDTSINCIYNLHLNISNTNLKPPASQVASQSSMVWHHLNYRTEKCPFKLQNCKLNCSQGGAGGKVLTISSRSLSALRHMLSPSAPRSHNSIPDEIHAISFARREHSNT